MNFSTVKLISLPLAALPFDRLITACRFRVAALSGETALAFSPRGIAPKLNRCQLYAVYRCGQNGENIDWSVKRCLPLGLLSAASGACAVVQISSSKRQCDERQVSLKAALLIWNGIRSFWLVILQPHFLKVIKIVPETYYHSYVKKSIG